MLAVVGYAVSAIGYAFLLLLILTVRKSGLAKYLLVLATAATSVWSGVPFFFVELSIEKIIFFDNVNC